MNTAYPFSRFSRTWVSAFIIYSLLYWLWFGLAVGIDTMAIGFYILTLLLCFGNLTSRKLAIAFSPLFGYLICYSSLKILHDYNPFPILIKKLYDLEVMFFGVKIDGVKVSLCEYFNQHIHPFFDIISGSFYITWAPFPILFGIYIFFKKKRKLVFDFWLCFLLANIFGFIIYILLPAAPPWYYLKYGDVLMVTAPGEPGGLARFDEMIGFPLYHGMYSQGTNTFGALPSMHAAFPLILSYYSVKYGNKLLTGLFVTSLLGIWFGAVYSNHHYLIDVIMGIGCGIIGIFLIEKMVNSTFAPTWYKKTIDFIK